MSENSGTTVENSGQHSSTQDLDHSKPRRLVPQFSLTSQNLGSENSRSRTSQNESSRKTVIRYTREQLIALRKNSKVLPSMTVMHEISSTTQLDPVCFTKLEPEDVIRICSVKETTVRGRGRPRPYQKGDDEFMDNYKCDDEFDNAKPSSLWDDDVKNTEGEFNLADIAQASLKFRSETENMRTGADLIESKIESILTPIEEQETMLEKLDLPSTTLREEPVGDDVLLAAVSPSITMNESNLNDNLQLIFGSSLNLIPNSIVNDFSRSAPMIEEPFVFPLSTQNSNTINATSIFPTTSPIDNFPLKVEWYYTDPQKQVQGPFSQENMRLWNEAGYFGNDLPIKLNGWSKFHLFQDVFPEPKLAFYGVPKEPTTLQFQYAEIMKIAEPAVRSSTEQKPFFNEKESIIIEEKAKQQPNRIVESGATEQMDRAFQGLTVDPPKSFEPKQSNAKTDFAKQLLGINRLKPSTKEEHADTTKLLAVAEIPAVATTINADGDNHEKSSKKSKAFKGWVEETVPKSSVSLVQIQEEEMKKSEVVPAQPAVNTANTESSTGNSTRSVQLKSLLGVKSNDQPSRAWSSSVDSAATASLMDIMNEEMKQKKVSNDTPTPSTWAAKAKPVVPTVKSSLPQQSVSIVKNSGEPTNISKPPVPSNSSQVNSTQVKSDFGGKQMSKEMSDWCSVQLKKINGSNDLTLMEFCMSLKSPVDIREYFAQYLGSSPQVTNFATEFIKLKEGKRVESLVPVQVHDSSNVMKKKRTGGK